MMKHNTPQNGKFIHLVELLRPTIGCPAVACETIVAGILERLWHATIVSAPQGNIGKLNDETIAALVGWLDSTDALISALVDAGWLDRCIKYRLLVHDWSDHCPNHVKGNLRKQNRELFSHPVLKTKHDETKRNSTKPNPTPRKKPKESTRALANQPNSSVLEIFEYYQRFHPKAQQDEKSKRLIDDRLSDGFTIADCKRAIDGCHASPFHCGQNDNGRKYQSLELIFRSSDKVNQFIELNDQPKTRLCQTTQQALQAGSALLNNKEI